MLLHGQHGHQVETPPHLDTSGLGLGVIWRKFFCADLGGSTGNYSEVTTVIIIMILNFILLNSETDIYRQN